MYSGSLAWLLSNRPEIGNLFNIAELNLIEKLKLSNREIKRLFYRVYLTEEESAFLDPHFASILKAEIMHDLPSKRKDLYLIFLNKKKILTWQNSFLKELLLYIFTHELVHIVRFIRYESNFYTEKKWEEEKKVHEITKWILKDFYFLPGLKEIFNYFDKVYT